jgi:hypothetical protein
MAYLFQQLKHVLILDLLIKTMLSYFMLIFNHFSLAKVGLSSVEDSLVSLQNSIIFLVLWLAILLSLYGTFYLKATPVHKVIALLLLSIFTVFL